MNPILERVLALAQEGYHPSSIRAVCTAPGCWDVVTLLDDWAPHREVGGSFPHHAVSIELPLPPGVTGHFHERMPDDVFTLRDTTDEAIETWIREVALAGSAVDFARFDRQDGQISFLTKPAEWLREPLRSRFLADQHKPKESRA